MHINTRVVKHNICTYDDKTYVRTVHSYVPSIDDLPLTNQALCKYAALYTCKSYIINSIKTL